MTATTPPPWLKPTVDYGPLAAFFIAYLLSDLWAATVALMVATAVAVALALALERRLPMLPLITAVMVGIFGGLTLWLQDETFIKMKPTIVQGVMAAILLGGLAVGRPLLKPLMQASWPMTEDGWRRLTRRFACFFIAMAALNEVVWRTQPTGVWVNFKVFGILALTFLFMVAQWPLLKRHTTDLPAKTKDHI
ncbi:MAG: septation protein A [Alphaproteobacteria bacterium]|nr:septation protein A [Alphaproteobacteria bacterium]